MNRYRIKNWSTGEEIIIEALSWDIDKHQFYFYSDVNGKIVESSYNCYKWDLREINYKEI